MITVDTSIDAPAVIRRVLAGDSNAYAELVRAYETRVRGYCRAMLRNAADADDAAQDVFLKAYQSLGRFRGEAAFSTWLYRIAANQCLDILRRSARRPTESWDAMVEREGDRAEALLASSDDTPLAGPDLEFVHALLDELPARSREVLVLRGVQGLSYEELAETLDCSVDAVKGRLKRARQEVAQKLRHIRTAGRVQSDGAT